jgi:hypothetical protein
MLGAENGRNRRKTVAVGCDWLPETFHGKEGVSGSSPKRALQKPRKIRTFLFRSACTFNNVH